MNSERKPADNGEVSPKKHLNIHVEGVVQGVGFRWWCYATAESLDLKGFVRNEDDGSVYIEVEGKREDVNTFLALCRRGPSAAKVSHIGILEGVWKDLRMFEVRHG